MDAPNVIIDTVKPAEDGSGDVILRLYESRKSDAFFCLTTDLPLHAAHLCDMLEQPEQEIPADAPLQLHARPFEIITLRLKTR